MSTRAHLRILRAIHAVSFAVGDWIFTTLAWLLLALGLLGLAWALLWDRSRGRRRCPKCWYVVDGVPQQDGATTCPECGKVVRKPRKFHKTRRRWGWAALAVVLLAGSYASHAYPIVRDHGWWRIAPDIMLIAMLPRVEDFGALPYNGQGGNPLFEEVYWRRATTNPSGKHDPWWSTGGLWPWERWLLRRQSLALLERASTPRMRAAAARMLAAADDDPVPLAAEEHRGFVALAWAIQQYETCDSYVEIGVAVKHDPRRIGFGFEEDLSPEFFLTAFERGVRVHQEACIYNPPWTRRWSHRVSWRGPDGRIFKWWSGDGVVEEKTDYFGAGPMSSVSEALDPTEHWHSFLDYFFDLPEFVGVETIRGRPCYHVREANQTGMDAAEVWIDLETGLVRQQFTTNSLVHYQSAFDTEVDASWYIIDLEHTDRGPLMQRLDQINALLPGRNLLEPYSYGEGG